MTVHYLGDIRNGDATVMTAAGTGANKARAPYVIPEGTELPFFTALDGRFLGSEWDQPFGSGLADIPSSAGLGARVAFAAEEGRQHVLGRISFSYSAAPTSGVLQIESPSGNVVWKQYVTAAGSDQVEFEPDGLELPEGQEAIVHLGSGGASVRGTVSVDTYRLS